MKKLFALAILLLCIATTACARSVPKQSNSTKDLYEIVLSAATENQQIFKNITPTQPNQVEENMFEVPYTKDFYIGDKQINANIVGTQYTPGKGIYEIYLSKDGAVEYRIHQKSKSFMIAKKDDGVLATYDTTLTETNLIQFAQSHIRLYIKDIDFSKYESGISTFVIVSGENSAWGETEKSFYLSNSEHELVRSYDVTFRTLSNGIATGDHIKVHCDSNGNIMWVKYVESDADWSAVTIDHEVVKESLDVFFEQYVHEQYKLIEYEINTQSLSYNFEENKVQLSVTLELTLGSLHDSGEKSTFQMLCKVHLDPT